MDINRLNTAFKSTEASRGGKFLESAYKPYIVLFGGKIVSVSKDERGRESFQTKKVENVWARVGCFFLVFATSVSSLGIIPLVVVVVHYKKQKRIVNIFQMVVVENKLHAIKEEALREGVYNISAKSNEELLEELALTKAAVAKYGDRETRKCYGEAQSVLLQRLCERIDITIEGFEEFSPEVQSHKISRVCQTLQLFIDKSDVPLAKIATKVKDKTTLTDRISRCKVSDNEKERLSNLLGNPSLFLVRDEGENCNFESVEKGRSGTYFVRTNKRVFGVMKPALEEPGAKNNPKGASLAPITGRTGIPGGMCYKREVAVSQIDRGGEEIGRQFANVPYTTKLGRKEKSSGEDNTLEEDEIASFQEFVPDATMLQHLKKEERINLLKDDVHRMAILDLRTLNADRHFENVLVDLNGRLVPIDHGLCLPCNARRLVFGWMTLEQSKWPLSQECVDYIENIDFEADEEIMRANGIEEAAIERARVATALLKEGVAAGLTLHQIGQIFISGTASITNKWHTRWEKDGDSYFETTIFSAYEKAGNNFEEAESRLEDLVVGIIDEYVANNNINLEYEPVFSTAGWTRTELGKGLNMFKFKGKMFGRNQKITVLRLDDPSADDAKFRLKVVSPDESYCASDEDPKILISKAFPQIPNVMAMVNGGYFHYRKNFYPWPKEDEFEVGDPVGTLVVEGKEISTNPQKPLWSCLKINELGKCKISERPKNARFAVGCSPVLISKGERTDLHSRTLDVASRVFVASPPGRFVDHIHAYHPRTAVGVNESGDVFLVCVKGRRKHVKGMSGDELACLMASFGASDALNLDGGGSSQMLIKKEEEENGTKWVSRACDKNERSVASALAVVGV